MHTSQWDRERFKDVLTDLQNVDGLSQAELGRLAGRHRTQVNRWIRSENQPTYESVRRLASAIVAEYPALTERARELIDAAGYGPSGMLGVETEEPDTIEAKATVTNEPTPTSGRAPDTLRSTEDIQAEIAEIMSRMTPEEIERLERNIAEEQAELERMMAQRRLRYARLMRGEPPIPD